MSRIEIVKEARPEERAGGSRGRRMTTGASERPHGERGSGLAGALRALRADLLTLAPQPLPPLRRPRPFRRLPHVAIVVVAALLASAAQDTPALPFAIAHAAVLVVALRWPLPAWWLSTAFLACTVTSTYSPAHSGESWPWTVHAGVLFLVALRNRPRVAAETLLLGVPLAWGMGSVAGDTTIWLDVTFPSFVVEVLPVFAAAVLAGAAVRARRVARERLAEQETAVIRERERRTLLEERARIARELHDVVAHHMSVISVQADAAPYRVPDPPQELVASFAVIRQNALEALTELRRVLGVLRAESAPDPAAPGAPQPTLDDLGDLVTNVRAAGLRVETDVRGTPGALSPGVELSAFRIAQEALSNALRHAPGARVHVEIAHTATALRLTVRNGPGRHAPAPSPGAGHGLLGMRERAAMLGGDLAAGPVPGGGYEVTAVLPLSASAADPADHSDTADHADTGREVHP
ncbi:sensor histidine kinase [Microbispora sp. ZYX-F-249]|uniref:histidine kinase n=1 Tax=Microbispora maris TaxID=3144104 RepID=A0ABV0AX96_9ACTN